MAETVQISYEDIEGVEEFLGKHLVHVRLMGDGQGFAFCLGDTPNATSGDLILCRAVTSEMKIEIQLHLEGQWRDAQQVIFEAPS